MGKERRKKKEGLRRRWREANRPLRHWIGERAFRGLIWLGPRLSHQGALAWGRRIGRLAWTLARKDRALVRLNLQNAFDGEIDAHTLDSMERGVFESLGMMAAEAAHSIGWTRADFVAKVRFTGEEHWRAAVAGGRGVILVTGHMGNWELMPPAFLCHTGIAAGIIARDNTNPRLQSRIEALRGRMGNPIFSNEGSAIGLIRLLRRGGALAMLADQRSDRIRCIPIRFFGRPALTPAGPAFLSRRTGAPIVPVYIHRRPEEPTHHEMTLFPAIFPDPGLDAETDESRMIQLTSDCLEQEIRRHPEQWVWLHDRWGDGRKLVEERRWERKRIRKRRRRKIRRWLRGGRKRRE